MGKSKFDRITYLTHCRVAPIEIRQQRTADTARYAKAQKEIASLSREGKIDRAAYRAEELVRMDRQFEAYDELTSYVERLNFNAPLVERESSLPPMLRDAVLGVMVGAKMTGFSSLSALADIITQKFGPELRDEAAFTVALATNSFTGLSVTTRGKGAPSFDPELISRDSRTFKLAENLNFSIPDPETTYAYIRNALEKHDEPADSDLMKKLQPCPPTVESRGGSADPRVIPTPSSALTQFSGAAGAAGAVESEMPTPAAILRGASSAASAAASAAVPAAAPAGAPPRMAAKQEPYRPPEYYSPAAAAAAPARAPVQAPAPERAPSAGSDLDRTAEPEPASGRGDRRAGSNPTSFPTFASRGTEVSYGQLQLVQSPGPAQPAPQEDLPAPADIYTYGSMARPISVGDSIAIRPVSTPVVVQMPGEDTPQEPSEATRSGASESGSESDSERGSEGAPEQAPEDAQPLPSGGLDGLLASLDALKVPKDGLD